MKLIIASDLHGDAACTRALFDAFDREQADKILLLGDLLYHGPRNDLPTHYAPKEVISLLNRHKDVLLCVRGNCEADVDGMVLEFPIHAEYAYLLLDGIAIYRVTRTYRKRRREAAFSISIPALYHCPKTARRKPI